LLLLYRGIKKTKSINQAKLGFSIILFIFAFIRIILCIVHKCKDETENSIVKTIKASTIISLLLFWILSLAIIAKVNDLRKDDKDEYRLTDAIKKGLVKILTADMIVGIIEICMANINYKEVLDYSSNYSPIIRYTYNNNQ